MKKLCFIIGLLSVLLIERLHADSNPLLSRVYSTQFTPGIVDTQAIAAIGTLDSTLGVGGILSVNGALSGAQAVGIQILSTGNFLTILSLSGSASVVAQYNAQGVLQTSAYGTSGIATLGTSSSSILPRASMFDTQERLLVAGGAASGTAGWIYRVSTAGIASAFTTGTAWQYISGLAQQSSGKIIAVGFNGTNAQIGRYTLAGVLDTTFGTSGLVALDGSGLTLPTVTTGLVSVGIDANDCVYIAFIASSTGHSFTTNTAYLARLTVDGTLDTTWGTSGILSLTALNSATSGLYIAQNQDGNFLVGAQVSSTVKVTGVTSSGGTISGFTTFNSSSINADTFTITGLLTTSDDSIFIVGSDTTTKNMAVIRLVGATGSLDQAFNTVGYNFFNLSSPDTTSTIQAGAIAPDGQLYTAGYQINSGTTVPYVARLNNTPYIESVAQYPTATEQGILDQSFGNPATQTYAGVVSLFNGKYGSSLLDKPAAIMEIMTTSGVGSGVPPVGDILVGMNGYTDSSASSNMMLSWMTPSGSIDTTINAAGTYPGYLTLNNSLTNEYLTSVFQGPSGVIYVSGYSSATLGGASTGAILRAYTTSSTSNWTNGTSVWSAAETAANCKGLLVGSQSFQTSNRILLFSQDSSTTGHISGYTTLGILDTSFGVGVTGGNGSVGGSGGSGKILYNSYSSLYMGPVYAALETGAVVSGANIILAAYLNASNLTSIDVAAFKPDGSGLELEFGTNQTGVASNIFAGHTINNNNIRMCFNTDPNIIVAAVDTSGNLLVTCLDITTGDPVPDFNSGSVLVIPISGVTSGVSLTNLTGVSDGTIMATFWNNAANDTMYQARILANGASLDTNFNSQGSQPGILPIRIGSKNKNRTMNASLILSTAGVNQGNIIMAGYESVTTSDSTPMVMRAYGALGTTQMPSFPYEDLTTPGTFAIGYSLSPLLGTGAAKCIYVYQSGSPYQGKMLVGCDNGTTSKIARINISNKNLDTTFGTSGIYTFSGSLTGINSISVDASSNVLVSGVTTGGSPAPWAQVLSPAASTATAINLPGSVTVVSQILQQKSGRYIVAAKTSSGGLILAYQDKLISPATSFALDPTFNPLAVGGATSGTYIVGTTGVYSIAINTDDTILAAYKSATPVLTVVKLTANGSGLVAGFGSSGTLATSIVPDSSSVVRVGIDSLNNVVVAASCGSGANVKIARYTSAGGTDSTWNGTGISSGVQTITNLGSAGITLSDLLDTESQQTIITGYNTAGGNGRLFALRLASDGGLDGTWNPGAVSPDTPGVLTFATNSATMLNGSVMNINGNILAVGQQAAGTSGNPIFMAIYGDSYIGEVAQDPLQSSSGILDTTIPGNTSGALALSGTITGVPQKIYIFNNNSNGAMMVASSNGTNSYVTKLNADLSLGTYGTSGVATLSGKANIRDMYITATQTSNTAAPIYVTGDDGAGSMWAAQLNAAGTSITYLASSGTLTSGLAIRTTSNSRILVAGSNGSSGAIAAFKSDLSAVDTSFGNNNGTGLYTTSVNNPICDIAVDSTDRIYIAYKLSASVITVARLLAYGTAVDSTFSATFTTGTAYSATQIRLALDSTNNQLIVAAQDGTGVGNIIRVCRFSTTNGSSAGSTNAVTLASKIINLSDLFLDAASNIYVVGYNSTNNNAVVARIASTSSTVIALDTTYAASGATPGIANVSIGAMSVVTAGAYDPDRRTYLVGSNGSTSGYMGRLFGDIYTSAVSETVTAAAVGSIDTTLSPNFTGGIDLSTLSGWSSLSGGYKARAVIANPNGDGTIFVAFGNTATLSLRVGKLNADMTPVSSFGTSGLTNSVSLFTVSNMMVDAAGNILVVGDSNGTTTYSFSSAGVLNATFETIPNNIGLSSEIVSVGQQKSGRYIVGCKYKPAGFAFGTLFAYKNLSAVSGGILPIDSTFGPNGQNGFYYDGNFNAMGPSVIDSNDSVFYALARGAIFLMKVLPDGSGQTSSTNYPVAFNGSGKINTGVLSNNNIVPLAINDAGNVLVGTTTSSGIQVLLYNGSTGAQIGSTVTVSASTTSTVINLMGAAGPNNGFYGAIYTTAPSVIVFAITSAGALDTSFGTSGLVTTTVQSPIQCRGMGIQTDGKILVTGYNNAGAGSTTNPIILRFNGYPYVAQAGQNPNKAVAGGLDTTLWPSSGALKLDTYSPISSTITTLGGSSLKRIYEYSNGKALLVCDGTSTGANTVLMRINKDLTLDTTFNTTGYITITGKINVTSLFVDSNGNIYVAGGTTTSWLRAYTSSGAVLSGWSNPTSNLSNGAYQVATQTNNRIILAGKNTNGTLYGYTITGALDTTFGTSGSVDMGSTLPITDIAIDAYNNIITVANNAGTVVLQKVSAFGQTVTNISGNGTAITGVTSGSNVKVVLDASGNIVVAAATSSGFVVRRYTNNNSGGTSGVDSAGPVTITTTGGVLANMYATSDGKVTLFGYNSSANVVAARLTSSCTLDASTFNPTGSQPGVLTTSIGSLNIIYDGIICADDRLMLAGSNNSVAAPYLGRIFGDTYVSYVSEGQTIGAAGTLNTTFGDAAPPTGKYLLSTLNSVLTGAQGQAILPVSNGGYYMAVDNGNTASNSILIRTLANGALDTSYNSGAANPGIAGAGSGSYAPLGVLSLLQDGLNRTLLIGTTAGAGWVQRYTNAGVLDTTFGSSGRIAPGTLATTAVEQTMGRLVVAGGNGSGGALFAYTSVDAATSTTGAVDTTFNMSGAGASTGGTTPGIFLTNTTNNIYTLVADAYDRLIYAVLNDAGTAVDLYRLTPNGVYDATFGTGGKVTSALTSVSSASQIRVALDSANRIVVAATSSTANRFSVRAFNNGTSTTAGGNGAAIYAQLNITALTNSPVVTGLIASADGNSLVLGTQSGTNGAWIARITSAGALDTTGFNAAGSPAGIFQYSAGGGTTGHIYKGLAVSAIGTLGMVGYENSSGTFSPTVIGVYDAPYTSQQSESPDSKTIGSIDTTLPNNYTGGIDLSTLSGWTGLTPGYKARAIIANPAGDGSSFIAFGNNVNVIVGKVDINMVPVAAFNTTGLTTATPMATVNSITVDAGGNIIVAGINAGACKVVSFTSSGNLNATFAAPTVACTLGTTVAQQKSGRYIVGSYTGSLGVINAYQNQSAITSGTLPVDATFGPNGLSGYYSTGINARIDDLVIDNQDYIYFVYRDGSNNLTLGKLTANGSGLVSSANSPVAFNSGAIINTGIVATQPARIAINSAGNILVGATTSSGVQTQLYNGSTGVAIGSTAMVTSGSSPVLTKLVGSIAATNEFYGSVYTSTPAAIVFAINSAGALDTSFGTSGLTTTTVQSPVQVNGITIMPDGRVVMVGYNNAGAASAADPILLRFNGYQYTSQYSQAPNLIAAGLQDTTLWPTSGVLELDIYAPISTTITTLAGSSVKQMYQYGNGKALYICDGANGGEDTVLLRLNKDLTLDTTFNGTGAVTITGQVNVTGLFLDTKNNIYVVGGTTTSWLRVYKNTGVPLSGWTNPTSNLSNGAYQVSLQSNSRIIVAGKNTNGVLYGYTVKGLLDNAFGTAGVVDMGSTLAITDCTIDAYNNIITVANNAGTVVLQKVSATGLSRSNISANGTAITTATSGSNIKVLLDSSGNIVVAAATSTGFILRRYINDNSGGTSGGNSAGPLTITATSAVLSALYATSDGKVTLIGYNGAGNVVAARITSDFALDSTFNAAGSQPGVLTQALDSLNVIYDGMICADDRIMVAGTNGTSAEPYIARIFGDTYVSYISQGNPAGLPGTLNPTFGNTTPTTGKYALATLNSVLSGAQGKAILPLSNGGAYIGLDNGNSAANSILIKTLSTGALDTSYNTTGIATTYAPLGINSILQDGLGRMLLVGTTGGAGWVQRYTTGGVLDTTFAAGGTGVIGLGSSTSATVAVEQTLARLVVAGVNSSGKGTLFAYTSISPSTTYSGLVDTTFNAGTGGTPGSFVTTVSNPIYTLVADEYDRLIFAILNAAGTAVNLYRLTASGEPDGTFGSSGIVTNALSSVNSASQIRIALDASGNILVAATSSTANTFSIRAFDNGVLTGIGANGNEVYAQLNITSLTSSPVVTGLVTSSDGYAFIVGNQSGVNASWVARITSAGALDATDFNPNAVGGVAGIFQYSTGGGTTGHIYNGLEVTTMTSLGMIGYENSSGSFSPTLISIYNEPAVSQEAESPDSQPIGTNDLTFGVSPTSAANKGIIFYGSGALASYGQVARALALQDDNNIVVALDGANAASINSSIYLNMFDNDGLLNPNFNSTGQATVLTASNNYQNQYVRDMITFTTTAGIHKAILAGYVANSSLNTYDSLVIQYNLSTASIDTTFGGFDTNPAGVAFGDGQQAFVVGQQSTGRIIVGGLSQDNLGLLLGYTAAGKLDTSFAEDGYQSTNTGSSGIYTHAIDSQNRIIIAYNNAGTVTVVRFLADGTAPDSTFNASGSYISTVTSNNNMKVAVDANNQVAVVAVTSSGNTIAAKLYDTGGSQIQTVALTGSDLGNPSAVYNLARLMVDVMGNLIIVAYDTNAHQIVIINLTSSFVLNTAFNGTGYLTYAVAGGTASQVATDAIIHPDGRIIVVGSES